MNVELDLSEFERCQRAVSGFDDNTIRRILNRGLNRGLTAMSARASKKIRGTYTVSSSAIKGAMQKNNSSMATLVATLRATGSPISLLKFKAQDKKPKGVFVTIKKGSRKNLPHSFFWGTRGSFHRTAGATRLPIKREYGPSIPGMLKNTDVSGETIDRGVEIYLKTVEHEASRVLLNFGG